MSVFTNADGFGLVPARLAVSPHDASQGRVSLQRVAAVAAVGDGGAELELHARPRPVADGARLEAGLPGVLCGRRERRGIMRESVGSATKKENPGRLGFFFGFAVHGLFDCYSLFR